MADPPPRLLPAKQPHLPDQRTPEQRYWHSFKSPIIIKESGAITHTHFSPSAPYNLAISSSARIQIYNPSSRQLVKSVSRFKDTALCAEFRDDGKLLLASDKSGAIQIFDLSSRAILRNWTPSETHDQLQVSRVKWQGLTNIISAGDDKCVRLWDITTKAPVQTFRGHLDYVRALATVPQTNLILSGSLDGTARLWDPRASENGIATFQHGNQTSGVVYSVLALKGGTMFLTAGGSGIKVWDATAGREFPVKEMWNHQKEVTALCGNVDGSRILAGGLDGHVKIYDVSTWKVVHGIKYPAAILTLSISPDEKHLAVGMSSALLSLRSRMTGQAKSIPALQPKRLHVQAFRDYESIIPKDEPVCSGVLTLIQEYIYREKKQKSLKDYDKAMLGFRYGDALDLVMQKNDSILIKTILVELKHQSALPQALHNRSPDTLMPILQWMQKNISDPRYTSIIIDLTYQMLDIYGADLLRDQDAAYVLEGITRKVEREINKANASQTLIGILDIIAR